MAMDRTKIVGIVALLVGLLFGFLLRGGGGAEEALLTETRSLAGKIDGIGAEVKGLGDRLGGVEGVVGEIRSGQNSTLDALGARLETLGKSVTDSTRSLGGEVSTAMQSQLEELRAHVSELVGRGGGGEGGGAPMAAADGTPVTPGSTINLADGKLRVFLSAANPAAGTARVAVNGVATMTLQSGEPAEVDGCRVVLGGFDASGTAMIDGGC